MSTWRNKVQLKNAVLKVYDVGDDVPDLVRKDRFEKILIDDVFLHDLPPDSSVRTLAISFVTSYLTLMPASDNRCRGKMVCQSRNEIGFGEYYLGLEDAGREFVQQRSPPRGKGPCILGNDGTQQITIMSNSVLMVRQVNEILRDGYKRVTTTHDHRIIPLGKYVVGWSKTTIEQKIQNAHYAPNVLNLLTAYSMM